MLINALSILILRGASRYPKTPCLVYIFLAENEFETYIAASYRSSQIEESNRSRSISEVYGARGKYLRNLKT